MLAAAKAKAGIVSCPLLPGPPPGLPLRYARAACVQDAAGRLARGRCGLRVEMLCALPRAAEAAWCWLCTGEQAVTPRIHPAPSPEQTYTHLLKKLSELELAEGAGQAEVHAAALRRAQEVGGRAGVGILRALPGRGAWAAA